MYTNFVKRRKIKLLLRDNTDVFGMANLTPNRTGLGCTIWVNSEGESRNVSHNIPRVKLKKDNHEISISIEQRPRILVKTTSIPHNVMKLMKEAMKYVGRNYDLFLKHFYNTDETFGDIDLITALKDRGEIK